MKFIIADDNKEFREYLRDMVLTKNDECIELEDGADLNSVYKNFRPDFVLLDIVMKKVDGLKAAENLKKEFPSARFIIISGYSDEKFRRRAGELGAEAFISKENLFELQGIFSRKQAKD